MAATKTSMAEAEMTKTPPAAALTMAMASAARTHRLTFYPKSLFSRRGMFPPISIMYNMS